MTNKIYNEPCLETLAKMESNSIDCVITSPPYWQLRDYGYTGQWGLEPTYDLYLKNLWSMMDEIYRVLKPTGTVWVNLGDTYGGGYSGQGGDCGKHTIENAIIKGTRFNTSTKKPLSKCLLLIPHRFAIGCIERGWILRNDCIWAKRNGMPESVTDRFSKKHEYFFFMVKSEKYFFDLDAIKDKQQVDSVKRYLRGNSETNKNAFTNGSPGNQTNTLNKPRTFKGYDNLTNTIIERGGKNPGSVSDFWDVPTKPSSEKHYASYNDSLLLKPVLAGCPVGGIIYDPFMGTGSTAEVALRSKRNFIGSEMSKDYCEIAAKRLEPFLLQQNLL